MTLGSERVIAARRTVHVPGAGQRVHLEYRSVTDQDGYRWVAEIIRPYAPALTAPPIRGVAAGA